MAGSRFVLPYQTVIFPAYGIPGAKLWFYESGTDTPLATYSNVGLSIANTNPVVADAGGRFPNIFMLPEAYKVVLTDSLDDEIWTADPVYGSQGSGGGGDVSRRQVSGNTTVLSTDSIIEVNAAGGAVKITYPLALGSVSQVQPVTIVKIDNTVNPVQIVDDGSPLVIRLAMTAPAIGVNMTSALVYSMGTTLRIL